MTTPVQQPQSIRSLMQDDRVKARFNEILGEKSTKYVASVVSTVMNSNALMKCDPKSVLNCAIVAATLDLPVNKELGFAWLVPYGGLCQFQIGYKGLIQLSIRTGQYRNINVLPIYKGQISNWNPIFETFEIGKAESFTDESVIGYMASFELLNGFKKVSFWTKDEVIAHGKKFSKTFGNGPWKSDFNAMACKTVLKSLLSKYGILSIEMQSANEFDQATVTDDIEPIYVDNETGDIVENEAAETLKNNMQ